ncbi:MAG: phospho-N-acetylmuramoyl-pentapeptide-transferase [Flavobacteriales bacterium]|jgi:phospho-N-acetylmuramoyl-pentapeptide-transferase|nr:phospho-N-acetylmuramoyl-pentapeptide-transferase [Flavobacteriales bacterium]MBK6893432.1 phospho-N-acetylmuramoyl-pentapeptide-transferase [Flavobacteriales bacterium]MBK7248842.1 phospho-N-acetylmuramoyl-pentapeptide-transferase [Flavobacteriales bacterium]MBK9058915.1 phospho-N-acetylmuramoyl-pentapeptide-transferase [Flavobacteriales bacterium]MBK9600126.1 phospho-N-acetylmuramoyl-pentapeptide-transferase [Flavobacteriales bacterium]
MLYHLFHWLEFSFLGSGVFNYISFRAGMALIISLVISLWFGKGIVRLLQRMQVGETVRDLGLEGQVEKQGTPTMGGLIIIAATIIPTLLFARLDNIYILLMLVATVWLGTIGFIDDYIKVFKKDKRGLAGTSKVIGQIGIGLVIGLTVYFHPSIRTKVEVPQVIAEQFESGEVTSYTEENGTVHYLLDRRQPNTTIPFVKGNELNYSSVMGLFGREARKYTWVLYVLVVVFIITAVSNGANITDGIDGLAAGTSAIIVLALGVLTYIGGNIVFAQYLDVMYIPGIGELVVFIGALLGACIGFLWYNAYPAQVFMGDTGSLALGGVIAVLAILVRKELLIPVLCGVFLVENLSVMMQVFWFKYTRKRYGEGRRIFKMAPLHHHYQKLGYHESKIVTRFLIVGVMLAVLTLVTLKLR